jgi:hypothetical protein
MADEGGASGAAVEAEPGARRSLLDADLTDDDEEDEEGEDELPFARPLAMFLVAGTISVLGYLLVRRFIR